MSEKVDLLAIYYEGQRYRKEFLLWPVQWQAYRPLTALKWRHVRFTDNALSRLPDKPGVYAFVVRPGIEDPLEGGFLVYVGKAARQTLKRRCSQYRTPTRLNIRIMMDLWKSHLYLYYAEVDPTVASISKVEERLIMAFCPPINIELYGVLKPAVREIFRS